MMRLEGNSRMLSTAARVTRRMTWLALVGGAAWLPVGVIIAAGLMLASSTLADAISSGDTQAQTLLIAALAARRTRDGQGEGPGLRAVR